MEKGDQAQQRNFYKDHILYGKEMRSVQMGMQINETRISNGTGRN